MPRLRTIVIIEDDLEDQELLTEVFSALTGNWNLKISSTAGEALNYLKNTSERTYIIISDMKLPEMDGLELKRQSDADERLRAKSIPFIYLTDNSELEIVNKAYKYSIRGYFIKPDSIEKLKETIKIMLDYWLSSQNA